LHDFYPDFSVRLIFLFAIKLLHLVGRTALLGFGQIVAIWYLRIAKDD